ncbi:organ-specific protein P4 isoform X1 [Hevea brasiliensis]|uniref:organ-specific protein P4 isoform X1 n=1 Tax=Hevea brasiliensis TaxID=3981 RepID=UPI0025FDAB5D|nr:organ-specific protein P4 isoform X1 [Hevea brasiliensis]
MKSFFAFLPLFIPLLQILSTTDARKDVDEYWRGVTKDQPLPEAIQKLLQASPASSASNKKTDCHMSKNVEPRPDIGLQTKKTLHETYSLQKFEPVPDVSIHHNDIVLEAEKPSKSFFKEEHEPRPDATIYHNDVGFKAKKPLDEKSFVNNFEPRPDLSIYHNDAGFEVEKPPKKKSFLSNFEGIDDVTIYQE